MKTRLVLFTIAFSIFFYQENIKAQLSLASLGAATIDFQTTQTGVNNGTYNGMFSPASGAPNVGQLDSDGIMVSGISNTAGGMITSSILETPPSDALYAITDGGNTWFGLSPNGSWSIILRIDNNIAPATSFHSLDINFDFRIWNNDIADQTYTLEYGFSAAGPWTQVGQSISIPPGVIPVTPVPVWVGTALNIGVICTGEVTSGSSVFLRLSGAGAATDRIAFNSMSVTPVTTASCTITNITSFTTANVEDVTLDLNWTEDGSGNCSENYLVVGRQGVAPASDILVSNLQGLYDETDFSANSDWSMRGNANEVFNLTSDILGADNVDYFVYKGTGTTASISGLDPNTAYNFLILGVDGICAWTSGGDVNTTTLLPIELSSFEGQAFLEGIKLRWTTETETNNDYMILERSIDRTNFREIGRIKGAGNTLVRQEYNFVDQTPSEGTNYYRLKQVDFDGTETYYHIIAVDFNYKIDAWQLSPTLAREQLRIHTTKVFEADSYFQIIDLNGKVLQTIPALVNQLSQIIELGTLQSGSYILQLMRGGESSVKRFIKN